MVAVKRLTCRTIGMYRTYFISPDTTLGLFYYQDMKKIMIRTAVQKMLADVYTPVGIYLRLRDRFRDTILLESTDFHAGENSYSFIGINAIAGIEISDKKVVEFKLPAQQPERITVGNPLSVPGILHDFMQKFEVDAQLKMPAAAAQGLFGYVCYDAVQFFDSVQLKEQPSIPLMRYRLYQYVIAIDHYRDELYICENHIAGIESEMPVVLGLIRSRDVPVYPFATAGEETSDITDDDYMDMVKKGIASCYRGDVFQVVLSRRFSQSFTGDEFNVYRALRSVNPGPYLFYFDYGDYRLMGSSPESQLIIDQGKAIVHPIAGTVKRTGDDAEDQQLARQLQDDEKENAEHVMLVDLARNDLSRVCSGVEVTEYKKINYYSHVIHLVSEVTGQTAEGTNAFQLIAATFPAGTLSGAPKIRAMQLINELEKSPRGYYGGAIGFIGFNGHVNKAIMIRSLLSCNNTLVYQAGAGVVAASKPASELQEVNNKLGALKKAIVMAQHI